jgi:hypothetical protein
MRKSIRMYIPILVTAILLSGGFASAKGEAPLAVEPANILLPILVTPEPIEYRMENSWVGGALLVGVPWLINKGRNSSMSGNLTTELIRTDLKLNALLRSAIMAELNNAGIQTPAPPAVSINPTKPWDVKYGAIKANGNAILHVYVERVGLQSRGTSATYQPFAHVVYCLVLPSKGNDCAYGDRSYYGEGYMEEDYLVYPADIADQWADEADVFRRLPSVEKALEKAITKISKGISTEVIKNITEAHTK